MDDAEWTGTLKRLGDDLLDAIKEMRRRDRPSERIEQLQSCVFALIDEHDATCGDRASVEKKKPATA
ncbi:MAG: hypothetical protein AAF526_08610 [Pseudomonadota bacterium]